MEIKSYYVAATVNSSGEEPVGNDVLVLTGSSGSTIVKSIKVSTVDAAIVTVKYKSSTDSELFSFKLNLKDDGYVLIDSFDVINSGEKLYFNADKTTCKLKADVVEQ